MIDKLLLVCFTLLSITGCKLENTISSTQKHNIEFNIIKPHNGIYAIIEKDVDYSALSNDFYEKIYKIEDNILKIERYNKKSNLTDSLNVSAITKFEYSNDGNIKFQKYYNSINEKSINKSFGYHSVEYIYDNLNRIKAEIYRDTSNNFLNVPYDQNGELSNVNFLSPIIVYEYIGERTKIKAYDENLNLLGEVIGNKPCLPFIDCGDE